MTDPIGSNTEYQDPLERLQVYRLTLETARFARADAMSMGKDPLLRDLGGQLLRAAASIAANVAEGYSRGTTAERRKFLEYSLGSAPGTPHRSSPPRIPHPQGRQ